MIADYAKHICVFSLIFLATSAVTAQDSAWLTQFDSVSTNLIDESLADSQAYDRLAFMTETFGPRLSGSQNLEDAIDWVVATMKEDGLENVRTQDVQVPVWKRGQESLVLDSPRRQILPMLGLGGSIATPPEGIQAEVVVVNSFDELDAVLDKVEGKIVLFNAPFTSYGQTVLYRVRGATVAARAGAVASLIRSVGPFSMQTPHTGSMRYEEGVPKIPHAAITPEYGDMLYRMQERGEKLVVTLKMEAENLPDATSRNVIAEIVGSEFPDEVIVLGGHIDSWDVGTGAMDDGGGCIAAWDALRRIKKLGFRPKRTLRVVLWTNEENGLKGALEYHESVKEEMDNHILAIESDSGVFEPRGFGFSGSDEAYEIVSSIGTLLEPIGSTLVRKGGGGADIGPLMRDGVPGMGLLVEGDKYFWYHHTHADTVDKLDPKELAKCVATMGVMAYVVADLDQRLPRKVN